MHRVSKTTGSRPCEKPARATHLERAGNTSEDEISLLFLMGQVAQECAMRSQ